MKVCHILNMAQDAYNVCTALRKIGVDADLIIDESDFGMGLPFWEEAEYMGDPYNVDFREALALFRLPDWVHVWRNKYGSWLPQKVSDLFRMASRYDLLHLHAQSCIYLQYSGKPYVVHEAGLVRQLYERNGNVERFVRRAYREADKVVWTNPDTYDMVKGVVDESDMRFIPFAVNSKKYKPAKNRGQSKEVLKFLHPSRQVYDVKGNLLLLKAFKAYLESGYKAELTCVDWGWAEDVEESKRYCKDNGLAVKWIQPMSKPLLIRKINNSDAVFDQFILGSSGTLGLEAMSCASPVCMYLSPRHSEFYGEEAPVLNAHTVESILEAMVTLRDAETRFNLGNSGRSYVKRHCNPVDVAKQTRNVYKEILP
jgi:glycosyltransferase involved in cell wall biosynthesis